MPRLLRPRTLYQICIVDIVQRMGHSPHMGTAWETEWCKIFQHVDDCKSSLTADQDLAEILAEMIEELKLRKLLRKEHLPVLIRSNLRRLNLSTCEFANEISFIFERTQNLQDLDLSYCKNVTAENLCQLAQHSPNLKIVSLRGTPCNDEVLHKLGENCPSLEKLNVTGCQQVTKTGASYALKTFKNLQYFYFPKVEDVILDLTNIDESPKEYKLHSLDVTSFSKVFTVLRIISHCPFLSVLHLISAKMTDSDLFSLSQLKHLQSLNLTNDAQRLFTYTDGVMPVLGQFGKRLTKLALSYFSNVDLASLSRLCPSLQQLQLHNNQSYVDIASEEVSLCGFGKLDTLELACSTCTSSISESDILLLVGQSHSLHKLFMQRCPALTDDVFKKVLLLNPLKCLEELHLEYCDFLTPVSVHLLLAMHNDLCNLSFYGCRTIQKNDCHGMKKIVLEQNLDVKINWSNLT